MVGRHTREVFLLDCDLPLLLVIHGAQLLRSIERRSLDWRQKAELESLHRPLN